MTAIAKVGNVVGPSLRASAEMYPGVAAVDLLEARIQRVGVLQMQINSLPKDEEPSRELMDELVDLTSPATMREIFEAANREMARVVKAVPRSWFVSSAPAVLDFTDPATYSYLRSDKARELRQMITKAKQPEEATKN